MTHTKTVHEGKLTLCTASFSRKTDIRCHLRLFVKEKNSSVPICVTKPSLKTKLKHQIESAHGVKKRHCLLCGASFS